MKFYKVLNVDGSCYHGGVGTWPLPVNGEPGAWMPPVRGDIIPCKNGYHVLKFNQLVQWIGPAIVEVEIRGDLIEEVDKCVTREARTLRVLDAWNERTERLFACDCAEHVLHIFEKEFPNDKRPRTAIEVARRFANGKATKEELVAAAAAASAAASYASFASASASYARYARYASYAARVAASAAASHVASAAARVAASAAASYVASYAASSAASYAASVAARYAAISAEMEWQTSLLAGILGIEEG